MPTYPIVPTSITVHLGLPDSNAPNVTVPFTSYIKNVASHELYPTWPEAALRANIMAQISFALNRVYTEFYRSRGYDFDITSTTQRDQAYVSGGNVFENISQIVDDIFNNYIVRQGSVEPLFAAFCDGIRTRCNGLSQWGSVDLAEAGYIPYEILQYYYGDDINIVFDAPVADNIPSYPGRPLERGSYGQSVRTIQQQLNRIHENYPGIPVISPVSNAFDRNTEDAVREFQRVFNLDADGIVGKATWYKIKEVWTGVKQLSELASEGLTLTEVQPAFPEVLRYGDEGAAVSTVQYYLAFLGYFLPELPQIALTGVFDDATRDAVYTFQSLYGLPVDGVVGRDTWNRLLNVYDQVLRDLPQDYQNYIEQVYPGRFLVLGDEGRAVRQFQENVRKIAAQDPAIPTVEADWPAGCKKTREPPAPSFHVLVQIVFTQSASASSDMRLRSLPSFQIAFGQRGRSSSSVLPKPLPPEVANSTTVLPDRSQDSTKVLMMWGATYHQMGKPRNTVSYSAIFSGRRAISGREAGSFISMVLRLFLSIQSRSALV